MQLTTKLPWEMANSRWAAILNPLLSNPLSSIAFLEGVKLASGANVVNHKLGRVQQGWFITDTNAAITYYRSAPFNDLTLTLTCSGAAVVNIGVF